MLGRVLVVLMALAISLPLCVCMLPTLLSLVFYGRLPLHRVPEAVEVQGLTKEEVRVMLGRPHEAYSQCEKWTVELIAASTVGSFGSPFGDGPVLAVAEVIPRTHVAIETWIYYSGRFTHFGILFGVDGRVSGSWI